MWFIIAGVVTLLALVAGYPTIKPVLDSLVVVYDVSTANSTSAFNQMIFHTSPIWAPGLVAIAAFLSIWMGLTGRGRGE